MSQTTSSKSNWNDCSDFLEWSINIFMMKCRCDRFQTISSHLLSVRKAITPVDTTYGTRLTLPRDMKLCWLKYESNCTLSGSGLKQGNCTFQVSFIGNICHRRREEHVWKLTASYWSSSSQEMSYIGCVMSSISSSREQWWGEERREVKVSVSFI